MQDYQVRSFIHQIASYTDRLALPLSHPDCLPLESRKAYYADIARTIDDLYCYSAIDSVMRIHLSERATHAYIYGGL